MYKQIALAFMQQWPGAEPAQKFGFIPGTQNFTQRVIWARHRETFGDAQEVQVVIAKNDNGGIPKTFYKSKHFKRGRSAIYQVANEPERVNCPVESACAEQRFQLAHAALNVPDRVGGHRRVGL